MVCLGLALTLAEEKLASPLRLVLDGEIRYLTQHIKLLKLKREILSHKLITDQTTESKPKSVSLYPVDSQKSGAQFKIDQPLLNDVLENAYDPYTFFTRYHEKSASKKILRKLEISNTFSQTMEGVYLVKQIPIKKYKNSAGNNAYLIIVVYYKSGLLTIFDDVGDELGNYNTKTTVPEIIGQHTKILATKNMKDSTQIH